MTDSIFDHDRLDVYRLTIEYAAESFALAKDVLTATSRLDTDSSREPKLKIKRIVAMLTRMVMKADAVSESPARYDGAVDYEHEHHFAEHEHEWRAEPEPSRARGAGLAAVIEWKINLPGRKHANRWRLRTAADQLRKKDGGQAKDEEKAGHVGDRRQDGPGC